MTRTSVSRAITTRLTGRGAWRTDNRLLFPQSAAEIRRQDARQAPARGCDKSKTPGGEIAGGFFDPQGEAEDGGSLPATDNWDGDGA